jgi:hypothetical protein
MATFYVLPPRAVLGEHFARFLESIYPGLRWERALHENLADGIAEAALCLDGVYVVFREELPDGEDTTRALIDGFGAETGDEIVEIHLGPRPDEITSRRRRLDRAA